MTDTAGRSDDKQQSRAQLAALAEVSRGLNLIENPDELCSYLCRQVKAIIGKGYVLASHIDETGKQFTLRAMAGFVDEKLVKAAISALGADPRNMRFSVKDATEGELEIFRSGQLTLVPDGIYTLTTRKFPRAACAAAEKLFGARYVYTIGFMHHSRHLGGLTILTASQKTVEANRDIIEAIMGQASVILGRLLTENALARSEIKYRHLTENLNELVYTADAQTLEATFVNQAIKKIFCYSVEEWLGNPQLWEESIYPEDRDRVLKALEQSKAKLEPGNIEYRIVTRNKNMRWVVDRFSWETDKRGKAIFLHGVMHDITEHKNAEQKLTHSRELMRYVIEHNRSSIAIHDRDMRYIYVSQRYLDEYKVKERDVIGKHHYEVFPDLPQKWRDVHQKVLAGAVMSAEDDPYERADGTVDWTRWECRPWYEANGSIGGLIIYTEIITERKRAEQALAEEIARRKGLFEQTPVGIVIHDPNTLYFLEFNDAAHNQLGYSREEFSKLSIPDVEAEETAEEAHTRNDTLSRTRKMDFETRHRTKQGEIRDVHVTAQVINIAGRPVYQSIWQDITERKKTEESLRESEARHKSILHTAMDGFWRLDLQGCLLEVNDSYCRMSGYSAKELLGMSVSDLESIETAAATSAHIQKIMEKGNDRFESQHRRKDGSIFDVEISVQYNHDRQEGYLVAFLRNITERKRAETEILRLNQLYAVISQVNQAVVHAKTQEQFLDSVCRVITEYGGFKLAWVGQLDHESNQVLPIAAAGEARDYVNGILVYADDRPEGRRPAGMCIRELKPVILNDFVNDPGTQLWHEKAKAFNFRGTAAFPILMEGQAWGALSVYSDTVGYFGPREKALLEEAASDIGFALENFKKDKLRLWAEEALLKSAEELQQSEERFRSIYENSTIGIYRTTPDGRVLLANPALLNMLGYASSDELASKNLEEDLFEPSYPRSRFIELIEKGGEIKGLESSWKRKDGSRIYVRESARAIRDSHGKTLYYDGIVEDITEHKITEEALKESEEKFRNLAEQSPNIIFINAGGRIVYTNNRAEDVMGYSLEELYSPDFDFTRLSAPESVADMKASFKNHMQGNEVPPKEYVFLTRAGERIDAILNTRLIEYRGEHAILGTITDISERKKAEAERRHLEEKAQVANRLAAVGEMAAGIAHEINNPLTGIIGFSELLLEQDLPQEALEEVKIIAEGSRRVADIVKRMLTFARQNKPVRTALDINALIDNTLKLRTYVLQTANITVHTVYDQTLPWITADPGQLQQAFFNLIINAEQAMKSGHNGGKLEVTTSRRDTRVRIIFEDDGPGITKENMERLFQPFFTTKVPGGGTGLGLSLARSIVLEHGGEIWAESQAGHGATFVVELPLASSSPPKDAEAMRSAESANPVPSARILVVDDESSVGDYLQAALTAGGHTVDYTGNPDEVLEFINKTSYDIIFLDIRMPGMSGMELYGRVLQKSPSLARKIIFMTGSTGDAGVRAFLTRNRLPLLAKPFEAKALENKIRACLEAD